MGQQGGQREKIGEREREREDGNVREILHLFYVYQFLKN